MDVTTITDIKELKALAYDQLLLQEQVQRNIQLIAARIAELEQTQGRAKKAQNFPLQSK